MDSESCLRSLARSGWSVIKTEDQPVIFESGVCYCPDDVNSFLRSLFKVVRRIQRDFGDSATEVEAVRQRQEQIRRHDLSHALADSRIGSGVTIRVYPDEKDGGWDIEYHGLTKEREGPKEDAIVCCAPGFEDMSSYDHGRFAYLVTSLGIDPATRGGARMVGEILSEARRRVKEGRRRMRTRF